MKFARWVDHLPAWLSFGAIATTEGFSPEELALMALPLAVAALVEKQRWNLERYHRTLEIGALVAVLVQVLLGVGFVPLTMNTLFLLCGIRLVLPRAAPQRRQLILMGFLLFLVTAIATFEISFFFWALAWTVGVSLMLLQQTWEASASLRRGLTPLPPYRLVFGWTATTLLIAGLCFVILPRKSVSLRLFPWGIRGLGGTAAGLNDRIELFDKGPISGNRDVVLRIIPPPGLTPGQRERYQEALSLLRGITLEAYEGQRWEARSDTPAPRRFSAAHYDWDPRGESRQLLHVEFFVAPNPMGIIPMPLGPTATLPPTGMPLREGTGGSLRWQYPSRRWMPLRMLVDTTRGPMEQTPAGARLAALLDQGKGTEAALAWSRRVVQDNVPPARLAQELSANLGTFAYTTQNPSGNAANPLQDFLERTRAGHCEYFASALALALRHRGVPARVVNGYRLGPWVEEGGYWLVSQDQAHSWVEFLDGEGRGWLTADPTPPSPPEVLGLWTRFQRWTDALRFRWDRNVVRFSDEDQLAGLTWIQTKVTELPSWRPGKPLQVILATMAILTLGWRFWRRWRPAGQSRRTLQTIAPLKPLLKRTRDTLPPQRGETARSWLLRLAAAHPNLQDRLQTLADAVDASSYGGRGDSRLWSLVREIARSLR